MTTQNNNNDSTDTSNVTKWNGSSSTVYSGCTVQVLGVDPADFVTTNYSFNITSINGSTITIGNMKTEITQEEVDIQSEILYDLKKCILKAAKNDRLHKHMKIHALKLIHDTCNLRVECKRKFDSYFKTINIQTDKIVIDTRINTFDGARANDTQSFAQSGPNYINLNDPDYSMKVYENIKKDIECPIKIRLAKRKRLNEFFGMIFR